MTCSHGIWQNIFQYAFLCWSALILLLGWVKKETARGWGMTECIWNFLILDSLACQLSSCVPTSCSLVNSIREQLCNCGFYCSPYSGSCWYLNCLSVIIRQPAASWFIPDPGTVCLALLSLILGQWSFSRQKRCWSLSSSSLLENHCTQPESLAKEEHYPSVLHFFLSD
jgi:hypothetical protein